MKERKKIKKDDIENKKKRDIEERKAEKKRKKKSGNREIVLITYIFVGLFILLIGNFAYYIVFDSSDIINNSYNKRQDLLAKRVVRGKILGKNGEILAETVTDKKGNEKRVYPYKNIFCHVVGRFSKGRSGIEEAQNFKLLTSNDNPLKKIYNELVGKKNIGDNIVTTLDVDLQKTAYRALGNHKGAIVALEPSTGKILAMVSKSDYDPNQVDKNWDYLIKDSSDDSALINRATQGLYPPGSTFKILTTLEYIRENPKKYKKYAYHCVGKDTFSDIVINCHNNKRHGHENLIQSFAYSCNSSFANIGMKLNLASFRELCDSFLFNKPLPLKLSYNKSSFVLDSSSARREIPQTAIGQGKTQISPIHNAMIVSAIANDGILMEPYVIDRIENLHGSTVEKFMPKDYAELLSSKEAGILTDMMKEVVKNGTATNLRWLGFSAAGKTGSAEYTSDKSKSSHAWFVGFAPADKPKIAVSIVVDGAGTGTEYAVPMARQMFQQYLKK